ncbi:hypothetical protein HYV89_01885 [Candidatus Woesearchaeota archaeon]|nr:hypothetical protein [Candidatus Woesearchaeota archaeon]
MKISNILIAAVFLVLISLFSLNFEELTGYVPKQRIPDVSVIQQVVDAGEYIDIRVKINGFCIDPKFEILTNVDLHKDYKTYLPTEDDCAKQNFRTCKSHKYCPGDIKDDILELSYKTQPDFYGDYKVRVKYIEKPGQDEFYMPYIEAGFKVV